LTIPKKGLSVRVMAIAAGGPTLLEDRLSWGGERRSDGDTLEKSQPGRRDVSRFLRQLAESETKMQSSGLKLKKGWK